MREAGVERIAVLRANAIGDYVFAVPALDALRAAYREAQITLLGLPWHAAFLEGRPGAVDRVVAVPPSRGVHDDPEQPEDAEELERFFEGMRAERFDLAVQLHGGGRWSNPFVLRLGARTTAGCRTEDAAPLDRWLRYVYFQPEVMRNLEVTALVGAPAVTTEPAIAVVPADLEEAQRFTSDGPFAVLHPGAGATRRRWPARRFAEVGDALAARGLRIVVVGTEPERGTVDAVRDAMDAPSQDGCDALSLGGLAGLLSRAALVVSNDSGPLHLAAAVGARSVGIYWIGNLINSAPFGRTRHRPVASFRTACPVCGRENVSESCGHGVSFVADVPAAEVLAAAVDLIEA